MDYLEQQAEESEGSTDTSINDEPKLKKRKLPKDKKEKSKKKKRQIASSSEDEDDEDDDARAAEEMKGFIADEEEEEPEEEDYRSDKSDEGADELEEDDLDLIDENLDAFSNKTNRKLVVETFDSDEEDDRTAIQKKLFGDGEEDEEEVPHRRTMPEEPIDSDEEGSEDNFIVNEDGERPHRRKGKKRDLNIPEGALDEARDIFGVDDFNYDDFYGDEDEEGAFDEEEEEIIDEEGEAITVRRPRQKKQKETIYDQMDPAELEFGFMTIEDKKIMAEDKPERFALRKTPVTEADEAELELESKWIWTHAFQDNTISQQESWLPKIILESRDERPQLTSTIKEVLRFIRNQSYEVPFIAFYRKEAIGKLLTVKEMWRIYEFDEKYCHLQKKKNTIMELMRRMQAFQVQSNSNKRIVSEADLHELRNAETEESLGDVYAQFQLYWGGDLGKMIDWERSRRGESALDGDGKQKTLYKLCNRTDQYQFCYDHGLGEFTARFGLTARQIAENMDWKRHEVNQVPTTVRETAQDYVSKAFGDVESVIESGIFMIAKEISRQPLIREKVRRSYRRRATINIRPTKLGLAQLDDSNPVYNQRYLKGKPIDTLKNDEFLHFWKLKQAGLITMEVVYNSPSEIERGETLADETLVGEPFKKDDYTESVEEWNKLRECAIRKAVDEMLVPFLQKELEKKLLEEAKLCVIEKCATRLARRIERQGFHHIGFENEEEDHEFSRLGETRVMAIAYPDDPMDASFGAIVNEDGNLVDYVRMVHFTKKGDRDPTHANLKKESIDFFKKMVERKRPHIIGICANNMEAIRLKKDLEIAVRELVDTKGIPREVQVIFLESDTAKVYMNSKISMTDFPEYPPILRQAISAARSIIDPMIEIASFFNPNEDILCWQLDPLQKEVDKEQLMNSLNIEMINRVCEVGVDINRCIDNPHHNSLIQFIAGLGPRKAVSLLKEIRQTTHVLGSRTNLVTHSKMGPKVFMNCAGFIKIEQHRIGDRSDDYVEILDSSRVHPETYEWARKMAVDALEVDDNADPQAAIEELMNAPDRLKDLDLDAFAEELDRQGFGEKRSTLYDIAKELHDRYKDRRLEFTEMTLSELYESLSREYKEILKTGKLVQGVVISVQHRRLSEQEREQSKYNLPRPDQDDPNSSGWVCQHCFERKYNINDLWEHLQSKDARSGGCPGVPVGVRIRLENGFNGFIPNKLLSDNPKSFKHPLERVQVGKMIWCRVQNVDFDKYSCLLSCRTSDLKGQEDNEKDRFWDLAAELADKEAEKLEQKKKNEAVVVIKRVIQHPAFQNISYQDAQRQLSKSELGECIIRPSSKSHDRLTVTWKVADGIYANVEIQEEDKEQPFTLGRRLIINGEEYEDLNEIIARNIQAMAQHARDIIYYKHFLDNTHSEEITVIERRLREERKQNPTRIPYLLTPSSKFPGKFTISFAHPKTRSMVHEYMTVTPEGIRFRQRIFTTFAQLIDWFKVHFQELPPSNSYR